ncbi:TetR family transcriptional regulator [Microbacterium sp. NPDC055910]|uniref:TetR family transcriptional regulator n=1 Tax=Microbacterium sp. NPDC055910 TaxID=3345659 RepID=UPI0035D5D7B4
MSTDTKSRIYAEAVRQFALLGYHGTSIRSISSELKIQVAGIYYYYPSKQEILLEIMSSFLDFLSEQVGSALHEASPDSGAAARETATDVLRRAITTHILCHAERQPEAFIADTELRSLMPENRAAIVEKRDRYELLFRGLITAGADAGEFTDIDESIAAKAIITMCTGVSGWFRPDGARSIQEVAADHVRIALNGLVRTTPQKD